ncbi:MAG: hypothetical protein USCGTAYLOR_02770 [Chromatiales bacterium USCg_Taylor]|nr:MAG: hypothetical protein USCGTAYLOR_02770 [Chromatiales bacterium USCg_Taylor]
MYAIGLRKIVRERRFHRIRPVEIRDQHVMVLILIDGERGFHLIEPRAITC